MLLLLQAAAQHLPSGPPPIYITMQQPSGGIPDWVKIFLGALLAVLTSVVMEFAKPSIAQWITRRSAKKEVLAELLQNVLAIYGVHKVLNTLGEPSGAEKSAALLLARIHAFSLRRIRFDFYVDQHKKALYDLRFFNDLNALYLMLEHFREVKYDRVVLTTHALENALNSGCAILHDNGIVFQLGPKSSDSLYQSYLEMEKRSGDCP